MNSLLGLMPLLAVSRTLDTALLFAAITWLALTIGSGCAWLLRNRVEASNVGIIAMALIAGSVGSSILFAQAFAYQMAQASAALLGLAVSNILLFAHIDRILRAQFESFGAMLKTGANLGLAMTATLIVVATVAQLSATDNPLPLVFIVAALLIALHRHFFSARGR